MLNPKGAKDRRSGFVVNGPESDPLPIRICDIRCQPECGFAEAEANARLIAASPTILAALERLVKAVEEHRLAGVTIQSLNELSDAEDQARAAIINAIGE